MATLNASSRPQPPALSQGGKVQQPPGLFLLFIVEMWERFSYYGMRGLLVLYLTSPTGGMREPPPGATPGFNPGRGWTDELGNTAYGWYTGMAYMLPIIGGLIADKFIGTHRSMIVGGVLIALGHTMLGVSGLGDLGHTQLGMATFVFGLALIVIGTGHFKPCATVMVGQLYGERDPRRETGFGIFYMGINLGAALQTYVVGTLGERVGWHWGFSAAAVGMLLGLGCYMLLRERYLKGVGLPPGAKGGLAAAIIPVGMLVAGGVAYAFHVGWLGAFDDFVSQGWVVATLSAVAALWAIWFIGIQQPEDRGPVASIIIFMLFNAVFWMSFEQAGSSINLFTDRQTDRTIGDFLVPTTWFQSINPWLIIIFAPITGVMWTSLARKGKNPSQPAKIGMGLLLVGLGYLFLVSAAKIAGPAGKAGMMFIVGTYFVHTMGEIILSPTGLSYVTKAAPKRYVSLLMGLWFISSFIANLLAGKIAAMVGRITRGEIRLPWRLEGGGPDAPNTQADFFFLFVVTSCGAGVLILVFTPLLKKLIGGREAVDTV